MGDLAEAFKSFATKGNNTEATTKDLSRWFTDTGAFTKKSCNSNNLDICFAKVKTKGKKCVQTSTWLDQSLVLAVQLALRLKQGHLVFSLA